MIKLTPPMGWNSWNTFAEKIDENLIIQCADAMLKNGLLDAGYEYLVIDDCWAQQERDENNCLVPIKENFPHGMKYISDYVHSKGLKFGMYSCAGNKKLENNEIGLHKKLINRGSAEFMCIHCLSKEFDCEETLLIKKIQDFKDAGCTLFV